MWAKRDCCATGYARIFWNRAGWMRKPVRWRGKLRTCKRSWWTTSAGRILHWVHKRFLVPSCTVDLTRAHPQPCLQYYIHRCLGPCVAGLTSDEKYAEAARDVRMLLEGRRHDLIKSLEERMAAAAEEELYEQAASYRDLLRTM